MIPRFNDIYEGRNWICRNDKNENGPEKSRCVNCGFNVPIDYMKNMRHSPFPRFRRLEQLEDDERNPEDIDPTIDEPLRKEMQQKEKRTINLLIHVLRDMPTVEKNSELTFL